MFVSVSLCVCVCVQMNGTAFCGRYAAFEVSFVTANWPVVCIKLLQLLLLLLKYEMETTVKLISLYDCHILCTYI